MLDTALGYVRGLQNVLGTYVFVMGVSNQLRSIKMEFMVWSHQMSREILCCFICNVSIMSQRVFLMQTGKRLKIYESVTTVSSGRECLLC